MIHENLSNSIKFKHRQGVAMIYDRWNHSKAPPKKPPHLPYTHYNKAGHDFKRTCTLVQTSYIIMYCYTPGASFCVNVGVRVGVCMQNVRANVKVLEFKSFCVFSCILSLLFILIKPLTTKAYDRRASGDCGTSGLTSSPNSATFEIKTQWSGITCMQLSSPKVPPSKTIHDQLRQLPRLFRHFPAS